MSDKAERQHAPKLVGALALFFVGLCSGGANAAPGAVANVLGKTIDSKPAAGAPGGPGLAIHSSKVLTCAQAGPGVFNRGVVLVRDGLIEAVGSKAEIEVPADYESVDVGDNWLMPGMIELHSHQAGSTSIFVNDINGTIYLTNPGLRASTAVVPDNEWVMRGLAGGVTSMLFIPGSATNIGGQGVLLKTGLGRYEENLISNPGSMKLAQAGNPERWGPLFPGRSFQNWHTRNTFERGIAYANNWIAYEAGEGPKPLVDPQFEIFLHLVKGDVAVSAHTQIYQVELRTIMLVKRQLGIDVFVDHGTFDGWRVAPIAEAEGVYAIVGPRTLDSPWSPMVNWSGSNPERMQGIHAGYQELGHTKIGFNTDAHPSTINQEELSVQAAMAVHYGFDDSEMQTVRGLTIIAAEAAGIDDRVGSLEVGKEADILVVNGHPADPRTVVERVWIEGQDVYDAREGRAW